VAVAAERRGGRESGRRETSQHSEFDLTLRPKDILADTLLADELAGEDVVEMANLTTAQTGVAGTIFISTAMGAHGPRVKYFQQPGRSQPSFSVTISDVPAVVANSLPARVVRQMSPQVIDWVSRNRDALLDFWHHGDTWTQPEVNEFIQTLQRV
jgi:hypothetical protein